MEDLSDRELMRYLEDSTAAKWFCNFTLTEHTPDYSVFSRFRKRLGTKKLSKMFDTLKSQLIADKKMSEVLIFGELHMHLLIR